MKKVWMCLLGMVLGVFLVVPAMAAEEQDPGMTGMGMGTGKPDMPMHPMMCPGPSLMKEMCGMMKDMAGMMQQTEEAKQSPEMMEKCQKMQQRCEAMMGQLEQMMPKCKEMMQKGSCCMEKKGQVVEEEKEEQAEGPITINININNKMIGSHPPRCQGKGGCHP